MSRLDELLCGVPHAPYPRTGLPKNRQMSSRSKHHPPIAYKPMGTSGTQSGHREAAFWASSPIPDSDDCLDDVDADED